MALIRFRRVLGAPVAAIRVWLPGGSTAEDRPGQAWVSGRLLTEGSHRRDWRRIADEAETRGIAITSDAGYEAQGLAIDALADDWELALEWAAELVRGSTFPEDRCRWIAEQTAAELTQLADHPEVKTSWAFDRQLYGDSARGRPLQGSVGSLDRLRAGDCSRFHGLCLERGAIVSVAGDLDERAVENKARALFGTLASPAAPAAETVFVAPETEHLHRVELEDSEQAHWFGGSVTASRRDADYWPLALLGVILGAGGGLSGRINHRVREVEGLAYSCSVATASAAGRERGNFCVEVGLSPERVEELELAVIDELSAVVNTGVTADELREARAFALGREPFARETARQWATLMAQAELFGLPLDDSKWIGERWRAVTEDDVQEVARRHLDPRRLRVTIGALSAARA